MNFKQGRRFIRDLKKLGKKYPTISQDLEVFKKTHTRIWELENKNDILPFFQGRKNSILYGALKEDVNIVKARMSSTDMNDISLRVIYAVNFQRIEITLIEIYNKHQKDNEDKQRWKEHR
ncbi:MAG: hypothetical protein F4X82_01710 [Candidatus Spechtbacteria bacterium SB0662_bin_43]|uniref:Type II toxin-antitoxin system RelE/ParE family toxin n=1 Tax=Candidatus Spechtbacteria bacterium SB0662_bin_43 TaxID=2604897 RepID=A0A845DAZ5_9BACT|nr:hypothetical protein [Candidatus Spechtbacteria bacterium SB0662_bin_43]